MGLLVLMLRSYLVFQNVYVTYKTLKMPPPSSRNGGKPTIRAMSQRKRDMKGCMTIWIVWCCLAAYEAVLEPVIGMFVPFYGEIKSLVLIAFILARARGAEPIYLHAIRPLVKPYMPTVDAVLDVLHGVGDFVLLLVSLPFTPLLSWWRQRYPTHKSEEHPSDHDAPPPYSVSSASSHNLPQEGVTTDPDQAARLNAAMSKFYAVPPNAPQPEHQFWQPPPFADDGDDETDNMKTDHINESIYDDEDSFDKTLRTPYNLRIGPFPHSSTFTHVSIYSPPGATARYESVLADEPPTSSASTDHRLDGSSSTTGRSPAHHAPTLLARSFLITPISYSPTTVLRRRKRPTPHRSPQLSSPEPVMSDPAPSPRKYSKIPGRAFSQSRPAGSRSAIVPLPSLNEALARALAEDDSDTMPAHKRQRVARLPDIPTDRVSRQAMASKPIAPKDVKDVHARPMRAASSGMAGRVALTASRPVRINARKDAGPARLRRAPIRVANGKDKVVIAS